MSSKLHLSHQICFPFYAISRKLTKLYAPLLRKLGLTYPQYLVMLVLWEKDGILIKDICKKLMLDTNTVSPLLENLHSRGIIRKEKKPENQKDTYIFVTESGESLKNDAEKIPLALLSRLDFDTKYLQDLHVLLWGLLSQLEEATHE